MVELFSIKLGREGRNSTPWTDSSPLPEKEEKVGFVGWEAGLISILQLMRGRRVSSAFSKLLFCRQMKPTLSLLPCSRRPVSRESR